MPNLDFEMFLAFILWSCGLIITVGGAVAILERWSVKFKKPEDEQNARLADHDKRILKLEADIEDMSEQLTDLKEMSRLLLAQVAALANGDADAIRSASDAIVSYLRHKI